MGITAGKPAQNIDTMATAIAESNKLFFMSDPGVSLSPNSIHVTVAAWMFILQIRQNIKTFTFHENLFFDMDG